MSTGTWYLHKAEQCDRLATTADNAITRARYQEEAKLWRQTAYEDAKQDRATAP